MHPANISLGGTSSDVRAPPRNKMGLYASQLPQAKPTYVPAQPVQGTQGYFHPSESQPHYPATSIHSSQPAGGYVDWYDRTGDSQQCPVSSKPMFNTAYPTNQVTAVTAIVGRERPALFPQPALESTRNSPAARGVSHTGRAQTLNYANDTSNAPPIQSSLPHHARASLQIQTERFVEDVGAQREAEEDGSNGDSNSPQHVTSAETQVQANKGTTGQLTKATVESVTEEHGSNGDSRSPVRLDAEQPLEKQTAGEAQQLAQADDQRQNEELESDEGMVEAEYALAQMYGPSSWEEPEEQAEEHFTEGEDLESEQVGVSRYPSQDRSRYQRADAEPVSRQREDDHYPELPVSRHENGRYPSAERCPPAVRTFERHSVSVSPQFRDSSPQSWWSGSDGGKSMASPQEAKMRRRLHRSRAAAATVARNRAHLASVHPIPPFAPPPSPALPVAASIANPSGSAAIRAPPNAPPSMLPPTPSMYSSYSPRGLPARPAVSPSATVPPAGDGAQARVRSYAHTEQSEPGLPAPGRQKSFEAEPSPQGIPRQEERAPCEGGVQPKAPHRIPQTPQELQALATGMLGADSYLSVKKLMLRQQNIFMRQLGDLHRTYNVQVQMSKARQADAQWQRMDGTLYQPASSAAGPVEPNSSAASLPQGPAGPSAPRALIRSSSLPPPDRAASLEAPLATPTPSVPVATPKEPVPILQWTPSSTSVFTPVTPKAAAPPSEERVSDRAGDGLPEAHLPAPPDPSERRPSSNKQLPAGSRPRTQDRGKDAGASSRGRMAPLPGEVNPVPPGLMSQGRHLSDAILGDIGPCPLGITGFDPISSNVKGSSSKEKRGKAQPLPGEQWWKSGSVGGAEGREKAKSERRKAKRASNSGGSRRQTQSGSTLDTSTGTDIGERSMERIPDKHHKEGHQEKRSGGNVQGERGGASYPDEMHKRARLDVADDDAADDHHGRAERRGSAANKSKQAHTSSHGSNLHPPISCSGSTLPHKNNDGAPVNKRTWDDTAGNNGCSDSIDEPAPKQSRGIARPRALGATEQSALDILMKLKGSTRG